MPANFTGWHAVILLVIILLLFGAPKLPGLAKSLGQSMKIFKAEVKTPESEKADAAAKDDAAQSDAAQSDAAQSEQQRRDLDGARDDAARKPVAADESTPGSSSQHKP